MDIPIRENCFLIAFEGPDQLGKTTQSKYLYYRLNEKFSNVRYLSFPNPHYMYGPTIGRMLLAQSHEAHNAKANPIVFQAICSANKLHAQSVFSATKRKSIIVLDRWRTSSYVYGRASGLCLQRVDMMCEGLYEPDVEIAFSGAPFKKEDKDQDAYEKDREFQERVHDIYREYHTSSPSTLLVNANSNRNEVASDILEFTLGHLSKFFKNHEPT